MQKTNLRGRCNTVLLEMIIQCSVKFVTSHLEGIVGWRVFVTMAVMTILVTIIHYFPPVSP